MEVSALEYSDLSDFNPVHIFTTYFCEIHFNVILLFRYLCKVLRFIQFLYVLYQHRINFVSVSLPGCSFA